MPTITAIVHTKNSQKTLEKCLASLAWCDEIFVVDMQSSDQTVEIAKKHKAHVFNVKTDVRFADPIRQEYLHKVKTDWTIIVDSDEEVPHTLATKVKEVMVANEADGYNLPRKNIIFDKWIEHTGFWPDYILRLFKTGKGTYPPQIHAQPTVEGVVLNLEAKEDFALIHHHYQNIETFLLRLNVYTSIEAEKQQALGEAATTDFLQAFFNQFFTRFFAQKGYKDGMYGFVLSLLMGVYTMVVAMKVWEKKKQDVPISLESIEESVTTACSATSYWVANEQIEHEKNLIKRIGLKVRRKMSA